MHPERPRGIRPYELFGITQAEVSRWRISGEKLESILADANTTIHTIKEASNSYGDFLFVTLSKGTGFQRVCMTFWGLGYHQY